MYVFLRTALLLNRQASELLYIPLISYFDDFVVISVKAKATLTGGCFSAMVKILVFSLSVSDNKNKPFFQVFDALGVPLIIRKSVEGIIEVANKKERKAVLTDRLQSFLAKGKISGKDAISLRSRLNFADGQINTRTSAMIIKYLSTHEMFWRETKLSSS